MSTITHEAASTTDKPLANILFDFPGADIILRSHDSYHFRVPKAYIFNSSPVLGEIIQRTLDSATPEAPLPVVQLPEGSEIILCLLTFIFPVTSPLPSALDKTMEVLSVAQKYQVGTALSHIRASISQQNSLATGLEQALHTYSLAQKYGLRREALQSARTIFLKQSMTIEDFGNNLDIMPGDSLYELWKYHERVRVILAPDLAEFRMSCARGTLTGLQCTELSSSQIPSWLDHYIESVGKSPYLFDPAEFNMATARHTKDKAKEVKCECASIPSQTVRDFWEALASVVHGSFELVSAIGIQNHLGCRTFLQADSALSLVREQEAPKAHIEMAKPPPELCDVPDANLIIRSSDSVNFRVHKSILVMVSPIFKDILSLPQSSDSESVDGLPVVQLSEDSELLSSLVSMLYPVCTVVPKSYDKVLFLLQLVSKISNFYHKVLHLLAACQKYEMASVMPSIRAKVKLGEYPAPKGAEAFLAYAIASGKGLIPEMENAAHQTLGHPLSFEILGEGLRLFDGWALRDLVSFRKTAGVAKKTSSNSSSPLGLIILFLSLWFIITQIPHNKA
jgi:hypothetical protein